MDQSSPNYVARLFYFEQIRKNDNTLKKKHKNVDFREKNLWEATCLTPSLEKKQNVNGIYSNLVNLIIYNQF